MKISSVFLNDFKNRVNDIDKLKVEIDKFRPLPKHTLEQLKQYFCIGLTYSSNSLEGNSLTETETKVILEDGITIGGRSLKDHFEVIGHAKAYDFMFKLSEKKGFSEQDILNLHKLFYHQIDLENAGKYRDVQVYITGTEFIPPAPENIPVLMKNFILNVEKMLKTNHATEVAALAHKEFVTIHPFIDGNGRCARLLMNLILLQHGYAVTIIPPIMRSQYLTALKMSQTSKTSDDTVFINFISEMIYESQKEYLRLLKA